MTWIVSVDVCGSTPVCWWETMDVCGDGSLGAYYWVLETQTTAARLGGGVLGFFSPCLRNVLFVGVGLTVR